MSAARELSHTPDGVCGNCLNGAHAICNRTDCRCRAQNHDDQEWWKAKSELSPEDRAAIERISDTVGLTTRKDVREAIAAHFIGVGLERAAVICDERRENMFIEHGYTEPDTNATYYTDDDWTLRDEECDNCAHAIRAAKGQP